MKNFFIILITISLLAGCTSANKTGSLQPSTVTNEVAKINLNLGVEYLRIGNFEKALEKLNKAYDADRNYYSTHNAYGLLYERLGKPAEAERHFKRAIALNNNDSASKNNYGLFLCQAGRYDEAEEIFLSAANNPLYNVPEVAITNAGTCALRENKSDLAETYFRRALSRNPKVGAALIQMAQITYDQKKYMSARGFLQRFLQVSKHTPTSLALGIKIEEELDDKNAVSSYELLLRNKFPDSMEAKENL